MKQQKKPRPVWDDRVMGGQFGNPAVTVDDKEKQKKKPRPDWVNCVMGGQYGNPAVTVDDKEKQKKKPRPDWDDDRVMGGPYDNTLLLRYLYGLILKILSLRYRYVISPQ